MPGKWTVRLEHLSSLHRISVQTQRRLHWSNAPNSPTDDLGPTRENAHQTFRVRKDKTRKDLPLPPLLDPVVVEKRSRWETTKAQPNHADLTLFQKKLLSNSYAHALASPVRQCRATLISLPAAFLTSLHARPHPTTNDPWLLPVSLTTDEKRLGPPYHFVGRQFVAAQLGKKKQWERGVYSRMIEKLGSNNLKKLVWREDLPDLILDLEQKQVVNKLRWNFGFRGRLIPVASPRGEDIEDVDDVSCVLLFGTLRTRADNIQDLVVESVAELDKWSSYVAKNFESRLDPHAAPEVTHKAPPWYSGPLVPRLQNRLRYPELEFKSTMWRGKKTAVYSLTDLLGADKAQQLIEGSQYAGERCVAIKQARHNVPVELLLMRLQAYIARCGP